MKHNEVNTGKTGNILAQNMPGTARTVLAVGLGQKRSKMASLPQLSQSASFGVDVKESAKMKKYKAKGYLIFRLGPDGIETQTYDRNYYLNRNRKYHADEKMVKDIVDGMYRWQFTKDVYDLYDGKDFLEDVKSYCITDYDGSIADVFVDGYKSNLGLSAGNIMSGDFLVSEEVWLDICETFAVEVNWANK